MNTLRSSLLLLAAAALPAAASLVGAPLVCFPIEVDGDATMPFAKGSETPNVSKDDLAAAVEKALAASSDAQFHMELLRRTGMANEPGGDEARPGDKSPRVPWNELIGRLERAALAAAAEPEGGDAQAKARRALRFFDLGYALEVGATLGLGRGKGDDGAPYLRKAAELAPGDRAIRFGVALTFFQDSLMKDGRAERTESARACYVHLAIALESDDARQRRNLLSTFGSFLDCKTHEQLVAEARRKLGGV